MQIQMTDIGTDKARIGQPHLSIHIGTVHIYLCATRMNDTTDFYDFRFKDTVRGRVGDHQCSQLLFVLFGFGAKIVHVYVSMLVAGTGDGYESRLDSRCRIGAVSRCRNQYLVAVSLSDTLEIAADNPKPCIFSCRTGIRLEADTGKSGYDFQPFTEVFYQHAIPLSLILGYQRMHAHKLRTA